jgi:hypothetical protein
MREMLCKMLVEMNESRRSVKFASTTANKAMSTAQKCAKRASILFMKLKSSTSLINKLKDDINSKTRKIDDLKKKW